MDLQNYGRTVLVDGDGSECGGCNVAQVTPSTKIRECANGMCVKDACGRWIALLETEGGAAPMVLEESMALVASMASMMASMASSGGFDGVDGVDGGPMASMAFDGWRRWLPPAVRLTRAEVACFQSEQFAGEQRICPCAVLSFMSVVASLA